MSYLIGAEADSGNRYVKMQFQAMPTGTKNISFDTIVPKAASTRHVAAAGFYHCLGENLILRLISRWLTITMDSTGYETLFETGTE